MKLREGQMAIDFTGVDIFGRKIKLSDYRGKKIILGFFRNVNCPFCNRRVHQIMGNSVRLKQQDVEIIFMFESSNEKLMSSVFHQGITPWPIIGDHEKKVYSLYGVERSVLKVMRTYISGDVRGTMRDTKDIGLPKEKDKDADNWLIPADFFIDENFRIVKAHYGKHLDDHIDIEEIKKFAGIKNPFAA